MSVWEVLRRSFFTTVITLLPIAALYIFGGATLQDFAFAIMVGIVIGAVGTIFIATPLLATLMERDPEYARRKDAEDERSSRACARPRRPSPPTPAPDTPMDTIEHAIEVDHPRRRHRRERRGRRATATVTATRAWPRSGSGGASVERRGRMDEPANGSAEARRTEHHDSVGQRPIRCERLLALVGPRVDEVRSLLGDSTARWRGDALRVGEGTRQRLRDVFRELGLVTRDDWDELELRVAQIEHRLSLLERKADEASRRWLSSSG